MPDTPRGYPYPTISDAPAGPYAFEQLADAVDADVELIDARLGTAEQTVVHRIDRALAGDAPFGPATDVGLIAGTVTGLRAGVYRIEGFGALKSVAGTNGSVFVTAGSTKQYSRWDLDNVWRSPRAVIESYTHAGGDLAVGFGYDCPVGSGVLAGPSTKQPCAIVVTQIGKDAVSA